MVFSSSSSEQQWVHQISKTIENHVNIDISPPACVFRVPQSLSDAKPKAYSPSQIGLGPYHHLRPDLHKMQRHKLSCLKKILNQDQMLNFSSLVVNKLKEIEPAIRASYDTYLELDSDALAWILAIDGLFLFSHLNSIYEQEHPIISKVIVTRRIFQQPDLEIRTMEEQTEGENENITVVNEDNISEVTKTEGILQQPELEIRTMEEQTEGESELLKLHITKDILMLENQIPAIVLIEIQASIQRFLIDEDRNGCVWLGERLRTFCKAHSPLELCALTEVRFDFVGKRVHLLDYMYYCIVNHDEVKVFRKPTTTRISIPEYASYIEKGLGILGLDDMAKPFTVLNSLPWDKITDLFGEKVTDENGDLIEEIEIPTVSELSKIAKVNFRVTRGGIRNIDFNHDTRDFKLPVLTLDSDSEVMLRNLVAYESSLAKPTVLIAEYVDLMCGIVDSAEDVKLLKEKQIIIIRGELEDEDEDVVALFNGISKSTRKANGKSKIEVAIEGVNEDFDKKLMVKAYKLLKKYVFSSWKVLSLSATVLIILLLIVQSFCEVYGCSTRIFGKS